MTERSLVKETEDTTGEEQQYVTFSLNDEEYAVAARNVREIIELTNITKVPQLTEHFRGVINLRGTIVPVVDLKLKFGMRSDGYRKHACIIVTEFSGGIMGLIVDAVSDVIQIPEESIAAPPSLGSRIRTDFVRGMGRVGGDLVIVLDVERVLSDDEFAAVEEAEPFKDT